jgi:hypothetical protein
MSNDCWKPGNLSERGTALWDSVTSRYDLRPDELAILADAAHEADIIERLRAEFETRDLITTGSMGQDVAAPHVSEIRQHRTVLANLLTKLRLPDDEARAGGNASDAGRALVNNRWHPRSTG